MTRHKLPMLLIFLLLGCSSIDTADIEFRSEAHPRFFIHSYGSYTWAGNAALVFDTEGRWEPPDYDLDAEIKFLIDTELRALGLVENSRNAELRLGFATAIDMQAMQLIQDPEAGLELLEQFTPQGALSVTFIDNSTGYAVWMGLAMADIAETPDPELSRKRLRYAVINMLKLLPR